MCLVYHYLANVVIGMMFNKSTKRFNPAPIHLKREQDAEDLAGSDVLVTSPSQGAIQNTCVHDCVHDCIHVVLHDPANAVIRMKFNTSTRRNREMNWRLGTPGQADRILAELCLERRHVSVLCIMIQLMK